MRKISLIVFLLALNQALTAQQQKPIVTVSSLSNQTVVHWSLPYKSITAISIQRSYDSVKYFRTIAIINEVQKKNEYVDNTPPSTRMFYRLFITFEGGKYEYIKAFSSVPTTQKAAEQKRIPLLIPLKDTTKKLTVKNIPQTKDTAKIIELKEVAVNTKKQLIEQDVDKLTYHADADPESRVLNALDLLKKVPMISVDGEDNIQLNGSSNYQVLINGKSSSLFLKNPSDIFKGMPASIIKDIEIITNPPSKYEAAGVGGIINIITYKKTLAGYNGSVNIAVSNPKGFAGTGYFTAKPDKLSISGYVGKVDNANPLSSSNFLREDKLRQTTLKQTGESNSKNNSYNIGLELNYEVDSFSTLSINYNLNKGKSTNSFRQQAQITNQSSTIINGYSFLNSGLNRYTSNDIGITYQKSFKSNSDQTLSLSYNFNSNAGAGPYNFIRRVKNIVTGESYTDNNNILRENILQADFVLPIKKQTLEAGIRSTLGNNTSDYYYKNRDTTTGLFKIDPLQSDNFKYQQNIHAAYTSINYKKNNWGIKAGVRLEQTFINAKFKTTATSAKQNYLNVIPNITLSQRLKGTSTIRFSYTQRIERPATNYLNPYVDLIDPKNVSYGNPKLKAAISNVFNFSYNTFIKATSINANAFYHFTNSSIQQFTLLGADTIARTTYGNLAAGKTLGLSLSGNTTLFKKLSVNISSTTTFVNYKSAFISKARKGFVFNISSYANYSINKSLRASGNIGYNTTGVLLQGSSAGYFWNSFSLFKDFLEDNRTTFSFSVTSPFNRNRNLFTELKDPAFYQLQETFLNTRRFTLSFNYRFAKISAESLENKITELKK